MFSWIGLKHLSVSSLFYAYKWCVDIKFWNLNCIFLLECSLWIMHDPFANRLCEKQYSSGRSKSCRRSCSGWDREGKYSCQEWSSASYSSATYGCWHNSEAVPRSKFTDNWIYVSTPPSTSLLDLRDKLNNNDFSMLLVPLGWKKLVPVVYRIFQNSSENNKTRSGSSKPGICRRPG